MGLSVDTVPSSVCFLTLINLFLTPAKQLRAAIALTNNVNECTLQVKQSTEDTVTI